MSQCNGNLHAMPCHAKPSLAVHLSSGGNNRWQSIMLRHKGPRRPHCMSGNHARNINVCNYRIHVPRQHGSLLARTAQPKGKRERFNRLGRSTKSKESRWKTQIPYDEFACLVSDIGEGSAATLMKHLFRGSRKAGAIFNMRFSCTYEPNRA